MQNIKIDKIVSDYIFNKDAQIDPVNMTKRVIKHCKSLENDITVDTLFDLLCTIDTLYKSIGLMRIINLDAMYVECDVELEKYINLLFTNKVIYKKIRDIKKANPTNLLNMIHKNFFEGKNSEVNKLSLEIGKLKNKIEKKMSENFTINVTKEIQMHTGIQHDNMTLTKESYTFLQKKIKNANTRKDIEKQYYKKSDSILNNFATLLIYRDEFAKKLEHGSYFDYVKQKGSVQSIKKLINDLIIKVEDRSRKETERIHRELTKDGFQKKIDLCDIVYYYEKLKTNHQFKPTDVLRVLLEISNTLFGISFSQSTNFPLKLWSEKILTCKATNISTGEELGHVHFDLYKTEGKKINVPLCIKISNSPTRVCLVASYLDINSKCMTYSDVILLFREFGSAIQMLSHDKSELIVKNDEFDILMSQIMEYVAWERPIVEKICSGLDKTVIDHILFMRYINFANLIKLKCVNSLFDHIIHNSEELINEIRSHIKNKKEPGQLIKLLYKNIYTEVMRSQQDVINLDIQGINPSVIYQEINGGEGMTYCNIYTEILSFAVYTLVKRGKGTDFIKNVLSKESSNLRHNLHEFILQLDVDSYDLYLREIVGYTEIDTEINLKEKEKFKKSHEIITDTSANHFCDGTESDDSDSENIIHLEKRIF